MSTIKTTTLSTQGGSTVPVDTVVNGTAKAWVNFNGTGTVAIRRAFNVSSITDNSVGNYTVNFTTAFVDDQYTACGQGSLIGTDARFQAEHNSTRTASAYRFFTANYQFNATDGTYVNVSFFS